MPLNSFSENICRGRNVLALRPCEAWFALRKVRKADTTANGRGDKPSPPGRPAQKASGVPQRLYDDAKTSSAGLSENSLELWNGRLAVAQGCARLRQCHGWGDDRCAAQWPGM